MQPPAGIAFGALPRKTKYGDGTFPLHSHRWPLIPRSEWRPASLNRHVPRILSQLDGMCTRNASVLGIEAERSMRGRGDNPPLSAEYHYLRHNLWGVGSSLDDALIELQQEGTISLADCGGVQMRSRAEFPHDHEILAEQNRLFEAIDLNADFDAVATALQRRHPCLVGVRWEGGGGHAVLATQLLEVQRGRWAIRGPNSWGEEWGEVPGYTDDEIAWLKTNNRRPLSGGFFTLTEAECRDFATFGCWAFGSSTSTFRCWAFGSST